MLRAAGRYGDAYYPAFPHRPKDYAQRLEAVRSAASDAGRDPMAITPALFIFAVPGRSRDDVDGALDSEVIKSAALNAPDEMWGRHGVQHPLGAGFSGAQDILPQDMDEETALAHVAKVPPSLMREIALNGTADEMVEQAAQWRDCGVRHMVVANIGVMQRSFKKGMTTMAPFAKLVRALKKL
jgi:phthiodiolone/phenolphthiodiolone dimycocerosates ketoreductase